MIGSRFLRASSAIYTLVYEQALSGKIHEKIWHNVATQRCKQFFWLLYRWRLPTAELLLRRNIVDLSFYSRCGAVEDQRASSAELFRCEKNLEAIALRSYLVHEFFWILVV